jgi:serine/threonine protein kinase
MIALIYSNDSHFVFRQGDSLYKLQPVSEPHRDAEFARLIGKHETRFAFWTAANRNPIKSQLILMAQSDEEFDEEFNLLRSEYRGVDCQDLFLHNCACSNSTSKNMRFTGEHQQRFITFLLESVEILSNVGVAHCDLRLANIVVNLTPQEIQTGIISTSLPIIIDFGQSRISKDARNINEKSLSGLFTRCNHGLRVVQENWSCRVCASD